MGDLCTGYSWTCRPILPILMILATLTSVVQCSQSAAALVSKSYPRGNHWAVGHLMGRKSVEMLPDPQLDEQDNSDYRLPSLERRDATLGQQYPSRLERASLGSSPNRQEPDDADRGFLRKSRWSEEIRFKYLREMPGLLLLGLNLKNGGSR